MNTLPETAYGTLELLYNTKAQNERMVEMLLQEMEEGKVNPLKVHIFLKSIDNLLNNIFDKKTNEAQAKRYAKLLQEEADKYPEKTFTIYGATIQKKGGRAYYDYSVCNDPELAKYELQLATLENTIAERQEFLKTVPKDGLDILQEDEVIRIYPPNKTQSDIISVTLPKQ